MRTHITGPLAAVAAAGTLAVLGLGGAGTAGAAPVPASAARPDRPVIAYVLSNPTCSGNTVTPINTATSKALKPIKVGYGAQAIAITPNGKTVYVASGKNYFPGTVCGEGTPRPANTVTPVSTATSKPGKPVHAGKYPGAIAITPDGKTAYVLSHRGVVPIHTATSKPGQAIKVAATDGSGPGLIAITPNGKTLYAASDFSDTVTPIRTATGTALKPVKLRNVISVIAITPDGKTVYVIARNSNTGSGTVTAISTATSKVVKTIKAGQYPSAIAIAPDGKTAYVISRQGVVPIHTATNKPGKAIKTGAYLTAIAITPNGRTVYVAGYDTALGAGTVTPIHTATNTAGKPITVKTSPGFDVSAIGITPNGKTAYLLNLIVEPTPGSGTVIPLRIATRTLGAPINVAAGPAAIVFTR